MLRDRFFGAAPFPEFVRDAEANSALWQAITRRARAPQDLLDRAREFPGRWYLLVLVEDWCGDAVNTVPAIAALAEAAPNLELRVLQRDSNLDLMDTHLTDGARSIPVVMVLNETFEEVGCWGPRPTELQAWVRSAGALLPKEERYTEVRRWYARDRGEAALREVIMLLEEAAACVTC